MFVGVTNDAFVEIESDECSEAAIVEEMFDSDAGEDVGTVDDEVRIDGAAFGTAEIVDVLGVEITVETGTVETETVGIEIESETFSVETVVDVGVEIVVVVGVETVVDVVVGVEIVEVLDVVDFVFFLRCFLDLGFFVDAVGI